MQTQNEADGWWHLLLCYCVCSEEFVNGKTKNKESTIKSDHNYNYKSEWKCNTVYTYMT